MHSSRIFRKQNKTKNRTKQKTILYNIIQHLQSQLFVIVLSQVERFLRSPHL